MSKFTATAGTVSNYAQVMSFAAAHSHGWVRAASHVSGNNEDPSLLRVYANKSVRNVDADGSRAMQELFQVVQHSPSTGSLEHITTTEVNKPVVFDISLSGNKTVTIRNESDNKCYVDLMVKPDSHGGSGGFSVRLDASALHGKVVGDAWFGGCSWSSNERYFAYIAQPATPTGAAAPSVYFDRKKVRPEGETSGADAKSTTAAAAAAAAAGAGANVANKSKFEYDEDWGECYVGVATLKCCVLDTNTGRITVLNLDAKNSDATGEDEGCIGQPQFVSLSGSRYGIAYTKWSSEPRRLGMIYCYQRPCALHCVDVTELLHAAGRGESELPSLQPRCLTPTLSLAHSARSFHHDDTTFVVFMGRTEQLQSHNGCFQLFKVNFEAGEALSPVVVVDIVDCPVSAPCAEPHCIAVGQVGQSYSFPGLYVNLLPRHCFVPAHSSNGRLRVLLLLSSHYGSREIVCSITVHDSAVTSTGSDRSNIQILNDLPKIVTSSNDPLSCGIVEVNPTTQTVLCSISGLNSPAQLLLLTYAVTSDGEFVNASGTSNGADFAWNRTFRMSHTSCGRWSTAFGVSSSVFPMITAHPDALQTSIPGFLNASTNDSLGSTFDAVAKQIGKVHFRIFTLYGSDGKQQGDRKHCPGSAPVADGASVDTRYSMTRSDKFSVPFECILISPPEFGLQNMERNCSTKQERRIPMVVAPHGGPHSAFTTSFIGSYVFLCLSLPCAVLLVNYRGSVGFGMDSIRSLLGAVGDVDITDVMACTNFISDATFYDDSGEKWSVDKERLGIVGGSHGGFLVGHAIGQFPNTFKAAAMRNPVTNIASMSSVSDIPDWCAVEALGTGSDAAAVGGEYDFSRYAPPTPAQLAAMYQMSPIQHVQNVVTPLLICLGGKDRRVPPSQGVEYFHTLRSVHRNRHKKSHSSSSSSTPLVLEQLVRMVVFPEDVHAIDHPASEAEHWVAIHDWLRERLVA